ncbi:uncharacterized protein LOC135078623 [Ostrinia nubilalis]|uniref:uncharacterized protein LOC135078623 n=1 Tax=Ostrinia nubilalis TaxID=29057 RepID=UPI0030826912
MRSSILLIMLNLEFLQAFFLFAEKHEPILFCFKICPLYCSPRRRDEDASSLIYIEDDPPPPYEDYSPHPYHAGHYIFCHSKPTTKPKPTTTTPMPTTTEEPTFICLLCMKKCGFPPKSR